MFCYCLFCSTTKCESAATLLGDMLCCRTISPKIIQRKWIKGKCTEEVRDYLPGYVFLYSDAPLADYGKLWTVDGVLRLLGQKEEGYLLTGGDRRFAEYLYRRNGMIGILKAYEEGDRVKLADSSFLGLSGEIIKLDRRKGRAQVQFRFDEKEIKAWVGYDLIDEVPSEEPTAAEN